MMRKPLGFSSRPALCRIVGDMPRLEVPRCVSNRPTPRSPGTRPRNSLSYVTSCRGKGGLDKANLRSCKPSSFAVVPAFGEMLAIVAALVSCLVGCSSWYDMDPRELPRLHGDLRRGGSARVATLDGREILFQNPDSIHVEMELNVCRGEDPEQLAHELDSCFRVEVPASLLLVDPSTVTVGGTPKRQIRISDIERVRIRSTSGVFDVSPKASGSDQLSRSAGLRWGFGVALGGPSVGPGYVVDLDVDSAGVEAGGMAAPGALMAFAGIRAHPWRLGTVKPFLGASGAIAPGLRVVSARAGVAFAIDDDWTCSLEADAMRVLRTESEFFGLGWKPWGGGRIVYQF